MNRRELMENGLGVLAATTAVGVLGSKTALAAGKAPTSLRKKMVENALECIRAGEACITACLQESDIQAASINACRECIAVCQTLVTLEAANSRHLRDYAALCARVCRDCEAACKADGDKACRECAKACAACAKTCEAYA